MPSIHAAHMRLSVGPARRTRCFLDSLDLHLLTVQPQESAANPVPSHRSSHVLLRCGVCHTHRFYVSTSQTRFDRVLFDADAHLASNAMVTSPSTCCLDDGIAQDNASLELLVDWNYGIETCWQVKNVTMSRPQSFIRHLQDAPCHEDGRSKKPMRGRLPLNSDASALFHPHSRHVDP